MSFDNKWQNIIKIQAFTENKDDPLTMQQKLLVFQGKKEKKNRKKKEKGKLTNGRCINCDKKPIDLFPELAKINMLYISIHITYSLTTQKI